MGHRGEPLGEFWEEILAQATAAIMSLIQSAKLNGHDPHVYLRDVFLRLPTQPQSRIDELLPHRWKQGEGRI